MEEEIAMINLVTFGLASQETKGSFIQTDVTQPVDTTKRVRKHGAGNKLSCTDDPSGEALDGQVCNLP